MPVIKPRDPDDEPVMTTMRLKPTLMDALDFIAEVGEAASSYSRNEVVVQGLERTVAEYLKEKPELRGEFEAFLAKKKREREKKREAEKKGSKR